ncbi:MAG TPA: chemotaxis protein CheD [Spirochaetota bacterium]|nr:chemotaxis protein CheD [Spirochaetota bacterium]
MHYNDFYLNPGELVFTKQPFRIKTILGSCVSVTLYDRVKKYGGMCHYMLPDSNDNHASTKYGNIAIPLLLKKFYLNHSKRHDIEAMIIGGAFILENQNEIFFIGDRNVAIAKDLLNKYHILVVHEDTKGDKGRTIVFNTLTGKLTTKRHGKFNLFDILDRVGKTINDATGDMG